jgi:hypothetical protein
VFPYLFDNHQHAIWFLEINNSRKLDTYCLIKSTFGRDKYLDNIANIKMLIALSRFRYSLQRRETAILLNM